MKKMGVVGLLAFLLVMSIIIPIFLNTPSVSGRADTVNIVNVPTNPSYQYDPSIVFQRGVVFNNYSDATVCDPWPKDFALGDLNDDELTDIAVISNDTNSIVIYNGTSDSEFSQDPWRITKSDMIDLRAIAIGDLDGDGKDDIVVSHLTSLLEPKITIFYQSSGFVAATSKTKDTYPEPFGLVIGEFSSTSGNDVAVVCRGLTSSRDDNVTIWRSPFGGLADTIGITIPGVTRSELITAGYVNNDGRMDLVVGNRSGPDVVILEQPSTFVSSWTKRTITVAGKIADVEIANITGNGQRDLAVAESDQSKIHLYYNTGSGLPSVPDRQIQTYTGLASIAFGELNKDTRMDMVTTSLTGSNASVFFQAAGNDWYAKPNTTFPVNGNLVKALVGDIPPIAGDVLVMTAGETNQNGSIEHFFSSSNPLGNANMNIFTEALAPFGISSGTFETGERSIAATVQSTNEVEILEMGSDRKNMLSVENSPTDVDFGKFDSGTSEDLAVANTQSGSVSVFMGSSGIYTQHFPSVNVTLPLTYPSSIVCGRVQDLLVDDIVVGCEGGVIVLYNTQSQPYFNPSQTETLQTGLTGNVTEVFIGEFNGDGTFVDIAALTEGSSSIQLFFRFDSGTVGNYYSQFPNANLTAGPKSVLNSMTVADINQDGRLDICATNDSSVAFVFLQPSYGFYDGEPKSYDLVLHQTGSMIRSADLNDDGVSDLVVSHPTPAKIAVYLNKGNGVFTNNMNFTSGGKVNNLIAEDIDGDGRADIASSAGGSFCLSLWYQNNLVPDAHGTASKYTENEGVDITFSGTGSNDSYSDRSSLQYFWTFGDGGIANGVSAIHRYLDNGIYGVSLRVTDRGGLTNYSNISITIADVAPSPSFTFSPSSPVEGGQVTFTDTSTSYPDQIVNWTWEFGDGGVAYTEDTTHVYMRDETYSTSLTVVDDDGSLRETTKDIVVTDDAPTAEFTISNPSPLENTTVYFDDASSSYPDIIVSYEWTFGDGDVATGVNVSHVYVQNGSYSVDLTITDNDGSSDTHWVTVQVQDSSPSVSFEFSPYIPYEGVTVQFADESSAYDVIATWNWDFGDGNASALQNPSHSYGDNGSYDVTLVVTDGDGSTSQRTTPIVVQDTSPNILSLMASSGATSFDEDENIVFTVNAVPGWESIERYEWDFAYSNSFVPFSNTIINHTSHSYPQKGAYVVAVRVWDSDSFSTEMLTIEIENVRPTANFVNSTSGTGELTFDASTSFDTPSDVSSLQFRWNFGDGTNWSNWSLNPIIRHTFVNKSREYSVVLNVKDNDGDVGTKTIQVIIDETKPLVRVLSAGKRAVVGSPTTISANVTDPFGVYNVSLHYRIGEEVRIVTMSQTTVNIYEAQIPSQNSTVTIFFWVQAFDTSGNSFMTGEYELVVQEAIPPEYLYGGIGAFAVLAAGLLLGVRRRYATVDEAFIIYEDGRLIAHRTRHLKPGMDDEVLSSMLVAIQNFVKDSFKDETTTALKRLDFGEKKILIEKGDKVYLAAVLHGKHAGKIPQKLLQVIEEIQIDFGAVFAQWDGDLESVRGVKDKTRPLFKQTLSITRIIRVRRSPQEIGPMTIECPICDRKISPDSKKCPSCGVDLSNASVDDLEKVAYDILKEGAGLSTPSEQDSSSLQKDRD
jgi:PKD repeat protein